MAAQEKSNTTPDSPDDPILKELAEAQAKLKAAEAKLAKYQDSLKLEAELPKLLGDYESEFPDLRRDQNALEDYYGYELDRLNCQLDADEQEAIAAIECDALAEIQELKDRTEETSRRLEALRKELVDNKADVERRKAELEMVKKPLASVRDRLKRADASKSEVEKAYDAREYARAFWLLKSKRKLAGLIEGDLQVLTVDQLREKIKRRSERYSDAVADTAATEAKIKADEALLKADQDRLAELAKSLDDRIAQAISDMPKAKAATPQEAD